MYVMYVMYIYLYIYIYIHITEPGEWPRTSWPFKFQITMGEMLVVSSFCASRPPRGSRNATRRMSCC